jgi:hypothetical protein
MGGHASVMRQKLMALPYVLHSHQSDFVLLRLPASLDAAVSAPSDWLPLRHGNRLAGSSTCHPSRKTCEVAAVCFGAKAHAAGLRNALMSFDLM